jgi:uncharacterized protein (TIRG00374 family)
MWIHAFISAFARKWLHYFRYAVALFLLVFLVTSIGLIPLLEALSKVSLAWGAATASCLVFLFILGAFNTWLLLQAMHPIEFFRFLQGYTYSWAMNLITPGQLGDASISIFLKKVGIPYSCSSISYLLDKMITLTVLCCVGWYGASILIPDIPGFLFLLFPLAAILIGVSIFALIRRVSPQNRAIDGLLILINEIRRDIRIFHEMWHILVVNLILTVAKWLLLTLCYYVAFRAFNTHVEWPSIAIIPVLSTLVGYLPISVGGIGTVEFTAVYLFTIIGIESSTVLTVYLFLRLLQNLLAVFMLALFSRSRSFDCTNQCERPASPNSDCSAKEDPRIESSPQHSREIHESI